MRITHGQIFPAIANIRANTKNSLVRQLADQANDTVLEPHHGAGEDRPGQLRPGQLPAVRPAEPPQGAAHPARPAAGRAGALLTSPPGLEVNTSAPSPSPTVPVRRGRFGVSRGGVGRAWRPCRCRRPSAAPRVPAAAGGAARAASGAAGLLPARRCAPRGRLGSVRPSAAPARLPAPGAVDGAAPDDADEVLHPVGVRVLGPGQRHARLGGVGDRPVGESLRWCSRASDRGTSSTPIRGPPARRRRPWSRTLQGGRPGGAPSRGRRPGCSTISSARSSTVTSSAAVTRWSLGITTTVSV